MPVTQPKKDDRVRKFRVEIGGEFIARDFGQLIDRQLAGAHAITAIASLCGIDLNAFKDAPDA